MKVEVSNGELLDKLSILEIKLANITDSEKLGNVRREHTALLTAIQQVPELLAMLLSDPYVDLLEVNSSLWWVEDAIRGKEKEQEFDARFISLARSVYQLNDYRASLKKQINLATHSELVEEKHYA